MANFKRILASLRIHIQVAPAEIIERKGKFYNELILKVPRDAIVVRKTECVMIKQSVIVILVLKMLSSPFKNGMNNQKTVTKPSPFYFSIITHYD